MHLHQILNYMCGSSLLIFYKEELENILLACHVITSMILVLLNLCKNRRVSRFNLIHDEGRIKNANPAETIQLVHACSLMFTQTLTLDLSSSA